MNSNFVDLRATVGRVLGLLGVVCALGGIFVFEGISIEFPGIMLGGLGYYFCLTAQTGWGRPSGSSWRPSTSSPWE